MALKKQSRWTRRLFAALPGLGLAGALGACALGACGLASSVRGQETAPNNGVARTYHNKPLILLPIEIDGGYRAQISSLILYAKEGANGTWSVRDKAAPMQTSFTFRAPRDGEYWFRIVAIDNQGKAHPDDLSKDAQDAVVVVVDSTPPALDVTYLGNVPENGQFVQCDLRDANPDVLKMRFFYQTRDQVWRNLEALPDRPNLFCVPAQAALTNFIRVLAVDLAGNTTARTLNLSELAAAAPAKNVARPNSAQASPIPTTVPQIVAQLPQMSVVSPPANLTPVAVAGEPIAAPFLVEPAVVGEPSLPKPSHPINPSPRGAKTMPTPSAPQILSGGPSLDLPPAIKPVQPTVPSEIETTSGTLSRQSVPANLQIVGSPQVFLNYTLENVGASGVGKMEIYVTRDRGQSWQKIAEENQRKNPAEIVLPGEGLFGIKLVAANGRGFGAQPPQAGDPSDWWIEVDTTKPKASITGIRPGIGHESGSLYIFWQSEDKNMAYDTVELYHAPSREGPWTPIAKNLKNAGNHRWSPPNEAGAHAFIRVVVRDKAGNVGLSETTQPVPLDDQSRPRVRLLGVTASPLLNSGSNPSGRIQPVETTNTSIDGQPTGIQPAHHTTSSTGVDVR